MFVYFMLRIQNNTLTFMVAGGVNLGKTTFINCLFEQEIIAPSSQQPSLNVYSIGFDDEGIKKKFTVIEAPSFELLLDDKSNFENIENYLKVQFDNYLTEESKIRRNTKFEDTRVHCLLYFISPCIYGLTETDLSFLKRINKLVNVIPVIGKSDGLTSEELLELRRVVKEQLQRNEIEIFDFSVSYYDYNLNVNSNLNDNVPFTIINYDPQNSDQNSKLRNLGYAVINTENKSYCDYGLVKELLFGNYSDCLVEATNNNLYEEYRASVLSDIQLRK